MIDVGFEMECAPDTSPPAKVTVTIDGEETVLNMTLDEVREAFAFIGVDLPISPSVPPLPLSPPHA